MCRFNLTVIMADVGVQGGRDHALAPGVEVAACATRKSLQPRNSNRAVEDPGVQGLASGRGIVKLQGACRRA